MAITEMGFTPEDGFRNTTSYPNPASGTEWRDQLQDGLDQIMTYINDVLIPALASTTVDETGAHEIGYDNGYATVAAALDAILAAGSGSIPPDLSITTLKIANLAITAAKIAADTITEAQMAADMKKQVGGVAEFDTLAAHLIDTAGVHGATSIATPSTIVERDANGRIKATAPASADEVALLSNVNTRMPIAGGTFTGVAVAQNNTSYTTKQLINVTRSSSDPSGGANGDCWHKYE